jgi:hypothetical protein
MYLCALHRGALFHLRYALFKPRKMAVASLNYALSDNCPISWPQATPLMLDYPLIPAMPEPEGDFVHRAYIEALWLPEVSIETTRSLTLDKFDSPLCHYINSSSLCDECRRRPFGKRYGLCYYLYVRSSRSIKNIFQVYYWTRTPLWKGRQSQRKPQCGMRGIMESLLFVISLIQTMWMRRNGRDFGCEIWKDESKSHGIPFLAQTDFM